MANDNLKHALQQAGLTPEQFADIIGVDPKTSQRWLAGRAPYPRHRAAIARALDTSEHVLWPGQVPPPAPPPDATRGVTRTAGDAVDSWGYDTDHDAPDPAVFVAQTSGPIDLFDDNWWSTLQAPGLAEALLESAREGRDVRVLIHRPSRDLRPLIGQDRITIKLSNASSRLTVLRSGDAMLLSLRLDLEADQPPPLLQLHRRVSGGFFDRLSDHLDALWERADETVTDAQDFLEHVLEQNDWDEFVDDEDEADEDEPDEESDRLSSPSRAALDPPPKPDTQADDPPPPVADEGSPRRWPRRPS
jgi:transcriptional regulator with XRE-family HTH domain